MPPVCITTCSRVSSSDPHFSFGLSTAVPCHRRSSSLLLAIAVAPPLRLPSDRPKPPGVILDSPPSSCSCPLPPYVTVLSPTLRARVSCRRRQHCHRHRASLAKSPPPREPLTTGVPFCHLSAVRSPPLAVVTVCKPPPATSSILPCFLSLPPSRSHSHHFSLAASVSARVAVHMVNPS